MMLTHFLTGYPSTGVDTNTFETQVEGLTRYFRPNTNDKSVGCKTFMMDYVNDFSKVFSNNPLKNLVKYPTSP